MSERDFVLPPATYERLVRLERERAMREYLAALPLLEPHDTPAPRVTGQAR